MSTSGFSIPQLRRICQHASPQSLLILVQGIGTPAPPTWFEGKGSTWDQFLPNSVLPSPTVYCFDHGLGPEIDSRLWSNILDRGLALLDDLLALLKARVELRGCAIVFIAHSLGGIIVKQCLATALERPTDFKDVVRATAAFIAIATPHSKSEDPKDWNQPQLLVGTRGYHKRGSPTSADDAKRLSDLCLRFEGAVGNLPILNLCETKDINIKSVFVRSSRALIVPENGCKIHSRLEEFIEVLGNHLDICNLVTSTQVGKWIQQPVAAALSRISRELQDDVSLSVLDSVTIASHDAADIFYKTDSGISTQDISNQATVAVSDTCRDGLSTLSDFSTIKRDPILPCHMIAGSKNKDFYGRDEIMALIEDSLAPMDHCGVPKKDLKTFGLCGPGGIGKTQVANAYAITHMEMFEAIFWVHAEEATVVADEFSRLAEGLGLVLEGTPDARDQVVTCELVKGWLADPVRSYNRADNNADDGATWLLIFDNVPNPDILTDFWPPSGSSGSVLITSRDTLAKTQFYQIDNGIDLPPLSAKHSAELLLKLTWRENIAEEEALSRSVAEKLGGLPLALTQMAGVMIRQSLSFADFLRRYNEEETHGTLFSLSLEPRHKRTNYGYTLASVWALEQLELSSGLLDVMSLLDPDNIPEKFLLGNVGLSTLSDFPKTVTEYQDARYELLKSSLIMKDSSASNLTIHRLIQDGARAKMKPERATNVFNAVVDMLYSMWPLAEAGVRHHVGRWKDCQMLSPHILRLKEHFLRAGSSLMSIWKTNLIFTTLLNELGWYFQERGYTPEAMDCYQAAQTNIQFIISTKSSYELSLVADSQNQSEEYLLLAEVHNNIAGAATEDNDADTARHHFTIYKEMLQDREKINRNVSDSRLTSSLYNLGMSHTMKGDYNNALPYFQEALQEAASLPHPQSKIARSLALINLGLTRWLMEEYDESASLLETALQERELLLGPNDRQSMITGRILHCLGNTRNSQGRLAESLDFHERALLHFKETVGNNHHRTGNSCFKVAEHYMRIKKLRQAIDLLHQAIKIFDRHVCYTGEKGRVTVLKSAVLDKLGEGDNANDCLKQARSLYQKVSKSTEVKAGLVPADFDKFVHVWGR